MRESLRKEVAGRASSSCDKGKDLGDETLLYGCILVGEGVSSRICTSDEL